MWKIKKDISEPYFFHCVQPNAIHNSTTMTCFLMIQYDWLYTGPPDDFAHYELNFACFECKDTKLERSGTVQNTGLATTMYLCCGGLNAGQTNQLSMKHSHRRASYHYVFSMRGYVTESKKNSRYIVSNKCV